jgi:hypothetical protein
LSPLCDCLFNIFIATLHIWGHLLCLEPKGYIDRGPHNRAKLCIQFQNHFLLCIFLCGRLFMKESSASI